MGGAGDGETKLGIYDKYLTPPHASAWQKFDIVCCVISLLSRVCIFSIDMATQKVAIQNI